MSNYCINQTSETSAQTYRLKQLLVAPLLLAGIAGYGLSQPPSYLSYAINETSKTIGQFDSMLSGNPGDAVSDFERSIADFYAALLDKQEPLGAEFADVLEQNRWNLYVRS